MKFDKLEKYQMNKVIQHICFIHFIQHFQECIQIQQ